MRSTFLRKEEGGPPCYSVNVINYFQASLKQYFTVQFSGVVEGPYEVVFYNKFRGLSTVRLSLLLAAVFVTLVALLNDLF